MARRLADEGMELGLLRENGGSRAASSPRRNQKPVVSKRVRLWVLGQMIPFYLCALMFMAIHLAFFKLLDGKPVDQTHISQALSTALANLLAIVVEIALVSGISVSSDQSLWRLFRRKPLSAGMIDKLVTLATSPWNLVRWDLIVDAPLQWLLGLCCILVPIAVVFPPGALTVEFHDNVLHKEMGVPTIDLSNFGNGSMIDFSNHAIFTHDADLTYIGPDPALSAFAGAALSSGEPITIPGPCSDSCSYSIYVDGPLFTCQDVPTPKSILLSDSGWIYNATDQAAKTRSETEKYIWQNMTFVVSWLQAPITQKQSHLDGEPRTLTCSTSLASYSLAISYSNGLRSINTSVVDQTTPWVNSEPVVAQFYSYFTFRDYYKDDKPIIVNDSMRQELKTAFTKTQALAIRDAAIRPLLGSVYYAVDGPDGGVPVVQTESTLILGSNFATRDAANAPVFNLSAAGLQNHLQNVVISTIALNRANKPFWVSQPIKVSFGAVIYSFSEPWQFYAPYCACLLVTLMIYCVGFWSLYQNGASAGNSFLQFVSTTRTSKVLDVTSRGSSLGGEENFSSELKNLKLIFGWKQQGGEADGVAKEAEAGFGLESEVERVW